MGDRANPCQVVVLVMAASLLSESLPFDVGVVVAFVDVDVLPLSAALTRRRLDNGTRFMLLYLSPDRLYCSTGDT